MSRHTMPMIILRVFLCLFFTPRILGNQLSARQSTNSAGIEIVPSLDHMKSIHSLLADKNTCPKLGITINPRVPADITECLVANGRVMIDALSPQGRLASVLSSIEHGSLVIPEAPPLFVDEGIARAYSAVLLYGARTAQFRMSELSAAVRQKIFTFAFVAVFIYVLENIDAVSLVVSKDSLVEKINTCQTVSGSDLKCDLMICGGKDGICRATFYFEGCPCTKEECPPDNDDNQSLLCDWHCGGADENKKCRGGQNEVWKGCDCVRERRIFPYNLVAHFYSDPMLEIAKLPELDLSTSCNLATGESWTERAAAKTAAIKFCGSTAYVNAPLGEGAERHYNYGTRSAVSLKKTTVAMNSTANPDPLGDFVLCLKAFNKVLECPADDGPVYGGLAVATDGFSKYEIIPPNVLVPVCDTSAPFPLWGSHSSYKTALNRNSMKRAISDFCKVNDGKNIRDGPSLRQQYGSMGTGKPWDQHQNIQIMVGTDTLSSKDCKPWDGKFDNTTCEAVLGTLVDGCNTNTQTGKRGGVASTPCMRWEIGGYMGGADIYQLKLHQRMVDKYSELEWTIFNSRGELISGPSKDQTAKGAPYNLSFTVASPTNKDKTNIKMQYPNSGNNWKTCWTGSLTKQPTQRNRGEYYCDDVFAPGTAWRDWERDGRHGFQRELSCYFRAWANNDGDGDDPAWPDMMGFT